VNNRPTINHPSLDPAVLPAALVSSIVVIGIKAYHRNHPQITQIFSGEKK
jgi:hypothetical protein